MRKLKVSVHYFSRYEVRTKRTLLVCSPLCEKAILFPSKENGGIPSGYSLECDNVTLSTLSESLSLVCRQLDTVLVFIILILRYMSLAIAMWAHGTYITRHDSNPPHLFQQGVCGIFLYTVAVFDLRKKLTGQ